MLLAITPNPTIDRILRVPQLQVGQVHRATETFMSAGGKGLNVARVARTLGLEVLCTGPLAGHTGDSLAELAAAEGLQTDWYWLSAGETRNCLLINHDCGDTSVINEPGWPMGASDWEAFERHVSKLVQRASVVSFSGSLPLGIAGESFARIARSAVSSSTAVYVDTSGAALDAVLENSSGLCIKINRDELAHSKSQPRGMSLAEIVDTARELLARNASLVVVTLGGEGAAAFSRSEAWLAKAPSIEAVSTVGSGDALMAGLIVGSARGRGLKDALALAVACGTANTQTSLPGRIERGAVDLLMQRITCAKL